MPYQNISTTLSNADKTAIIQKITEVRALLPFLINLKKNEKRGVFKLGKKAEKFLFDVLSLSKTSPQYIPNYVDMVEFEKDFNLLFEMVEMEQKLWQLLEAIADTRFALVQECQKPGLAIYHNLKNAALGNVPGADSALEVLKPYFKKERKKKK